MSATYTNFKRGTAKILNYLILENGRNEQNSSFFTGMYHSVKLIFFSLWSFLTVATTNFVLVLEYFSIKILFLSMCNLKDLPCVYGFISQKKAEYSL